jgi:hypothetical protein
MIKATESDTKLTDVCVRQEDGFALKSISTVIFKLAIERMFGRL